jgi:hypothetical protein
VNTTTLPAATALREDDATTGRRRAVFALAKVESIRLLRHPVTVVAVLFLIGIWVSEWLTNEANHFPVLQDVDRDTQLGIMLLLGGAAVIAGNLAVLRGHRHGTTALSDVLVLPYPMRTAAHLLAVLPLAVLAALLAAARIAVLAAAPAAGRANPYELATGPAVVLLFGAVGVLLGRLTRSAIVAPLALLGLLAMLVVLPLLTRDGPARWFQPVVPESEPVFVLPAPANLMARPAGPHLAYLVGLAVLVAVAALARSGARIVRLALVAVVALALTVAGGVGQLAGPSQSVRQARLIAMQRPAGQQTCQRLGRVTYCAFPDFVSWIPSWDAEVRGVLRRVPTAIAQRPLAVRQRIVLLNDNGAIPSPTEQWRADDTAAGTPNAVSIGTRWGDSRSASQLAALVAYRLIVGSGPTADSTACGARGVLVGWLAGQASAHASIGLRKLAADQNGGGGGGGGDKVFIEGIPGSGGILIPDRELAFALALLDRPADEIGARVRQSWDELTATGTTVDRAAEILGQPVPPAQNAAEKCR